MCYGIYSKVCYFSTIFFLGIIHLLWNTVFLHLWYEYIQVSFTTPSFWTFLYISCGSPRGFSAWMPTTPVIKGDKLRRFWRNLLKQILKWRQVNNKVTSFLAHMSWKLKWAFLIACCPSSVRLSVCLYVLLSVNFSFSSSSQEPLGQFQPNLTQSILGWLEFNFVQMKGHALFQGEIIRK